MVRDWDATSKGKSLTLLKLITRPDLVCGVVVLNHVIGPLQILTTKLQGRELDILQAYELTRDVISTTKDMRENLEVLWEKDLWPATLNVAKDMSMTDEDFDPPRTCNRQRHRQNPDGIRDGSTYWRIVLGVACFDHVLSDLTKRFSEDQLNIANLLNLRPANLAKVSSEKIVGILQETLDNFSSFFNEVRDHHSFLFT